MRAIGEAELILLGPGSLYTSVIPNLLVDGIADAVRASDALKIYICNIMTQDGETEGMTASDHVKALLDHSGPGLVDLCLCNSAPVRPGLVERVQRGRTPPPSWWTGRPSRPWGWRPSPGPWPPRPLTTPATPLLAWPRR